MSILYDISINYHILLLFLFSFYFFFIYLVTTSFCLYSSLDNFWKTKSWPSGSHYVTNGLRSNQLGLWGDIETTSQATQVNCRNDVLAFYDAGHTKQRTRDPTPLWLPVFPSWLSLSLLRFIFQTTNGRIRKKIHLDRNWKVWANITRIVSKNPSVCLNTHAQFSLMMIMTNAKPCK